MTVVMKDNQAELPAVRKSSSAFSSARRLLVSTLTATRGAPSAGDVLVAVAPGGGGFFFSFGL